MNPTESIEYFSTLQQKAHDDFAKRFEDVSKQIIDDLKGTTSYEDCQKVIG
jgi:hypothetical protein